MNNNHLIARRNCRENCNWLSSTALYEHPRGTILDIRIFSDKGTDTLQWAKVFADSLLLKSFNNIRHFSRMIWVYAGQGAELDDLWSSFPELYFYVPVKTTTSVLLTWNKEEAERNCTFESELIHWSGFWALILCNDLSKNTNKMDNLTQN